MNMQRNVLKVPTVIKFRRLLSQVVTKQEINNEDTIDMSTLYVPISSGGKIYQIVKPKIDVDYLIQYSEAIQKSCDIRNINLNICEVLQYAKKWRVIAEKKEALSLELWKYSVDNKTTNENKPPKEYIIDLSKKLKLCKKELKPLDDIVMPMFSKIPNILHKNCPETTDVPHTVLENKEFPFVVKSHVALAKSISCIEFSKVSPTAYYLIGRLAHLEQAVQSFFEKQLEDKSFIPILGIDFAKSFVFEAIGKNPFNLNNCIMLKHEKKEMDQCNNLIGGSSFEIFCSYFINMNIDQDTLPIKYYSSGRFYNANHRESEIFNLFNVIQSNCLRCFIASKPNNNNNDIYFEELLNTLMHCFSLLHIPYRILNVSAKNLNPTESRKIRIELWSPAEEKYITCGDVIQSDDFITKRLQMSYGVEFKKGGYFNIVHGFAVNIQVLLGCIIENMQHIDSTFSVPDVLKDYMFE